MLKKIIQTRKAPLSKSMGPHVKQVIPSAVENMDPFVFLDHFGPIEKKPGAQGVPPHPHAGIATITYLFSGSNRHQDSRGHDQIIEAGDIAWMQAGKGIVHAEGMNETRSKNEMVHGLQLWISLPAKDKFIEPDFFHYTSAQLPVFEHQNAKIKVLCGELLGFRSPVKSLSPAYLFEVFLPSNTTLDLPIPENYTGGLYLVEGKIECQDVHLEQSSMTKFDLAGNSISVKAESDAHFMLLGGAPLNEPIFAYASFVMNSKEQIQQVIMDYSTGKMGELVI